MKTTYTVLTAFALFAVASRSSAQEVAKVAVASPKPAVAESVASVDTSKKAKQAPTVAFAAMGPQVEIQNYRPEDKRGVNVFEAPKDDSIPYTGFKLQFGAAFTQQLQGLDHSNTAAPRPVTTNGVTTNANQLIRIGHGPNNAVANIYLNAQLARGIRVAMTTYSSARHHQETWVKDGYLLVDALPFDWELTNSLMASLRPSPVMVLIPVFGAAATTS